MGGSYLRLELSWCEIAEAQHVWALFVVVPSPAFDLDLGFRPIPKPLERQAFVPELPVERFVGAILPRLARIDEVGVNPRGRQPAEDRRGNELGAIV